jgi:Tfp pilus assembly ATPase PilU
MQVLALIRTYPKENSQKGVDDLSVDLHNLVSLLLMQRRRTKRYRVVVRWAVDACSARCGFGGECVIDL